MKELQDLQAGLRKFKTEQSKAIEGSKEWQDATDNIEKVKLEAERSRNAFSAYFKTFDIGSKSVNDLTAAQRQLNAIVRNLEPGTKEWNEFSGILNQVKKRIGSLNKEFQDTETVLCKTSKAAKTLSDYVISFAGIGRAIEGVVNQLSNLTEAYLEYSDLQADVQKTTGLTKTEVEAMGEAFKNIDTRSSRNELMELAAAAGKLGITGRENVEGFVRAADQINVALGEDLGEGAIREIGKISDVFGLTDLYGIEQAYLKIGSAINSLGQSSTAAEGYLVDFTQRMSGVAKQAGISVEQILGYGSALDQNGQNVEMAATAFQGFITRMFSDTATFAQIAKMDVENFTQLLQTDANQAIRTVLSALSEQGGFQQLIPVFESMKLDGSRAVAVLASMASNIQAVETAQEDAAKAFAEGTSITNEFATKNNNAAARVEKMRNELTDLRVEIGENLLPVFLKAGNAFSAIIQVIGTLTSYLPKSTGALVAYGAAVLALTVNKTKLVKVAKTATTAIKGFFTTLASNPIGLAVAAVGLLVGKILELTRATRESNRAFKDFEAGLNAELSGIDAVFRKLKDAEKGTRDYADAKKVIIDQYGQYLQGLINEQGELANVEEAYKRVTKAVKDRWAQEALAKRTAEINEESFAEQAKYTQRMRNKLPESNVREYQISQIQGFQGDYVEYNSSLNDYYATDEFEDFLASLGLDDLKVGALHTIARNAQKIRSSENRRQRDIAKEEQKYAPFMADYDLKNQIAAAEEELKMLEEQKVLVSTLTPMMDTGKIDRQIQDLKLRLQGLYAMLNPKIEENGNGGTTVSPSPVPSGSGETGGGSGSPVAATDPDAAARKEAQAQAARLAELQKANNRAQAMLEELMEKAERSRMSADELEIDNVRKKYEKAIAEAVAYKNRLDTILSDPEATEADRAYAAANFGQATDRVDYITQSRDNEIQATRDRQNRDHWDSWNELKKTRYGTTSEKERRDAALAEVENWRNEEKQKLQTGFSALGLEEGSEAYLEQYQALKDKEAEIDRAANEQKLEIETAFQEERMSKIAAGIQAAQSLLSEASEITSQLKDLELQKSEQIYDKEKEALDKMLKEKRISQEDYNTKMEELEEEKQEREKQIRKKYLVAEFAMQVAQIIATTALASMQAYSAMAGLPFAGPGLAAAAAATTAAFGAVQLGIATAQYEIAKGYSEGGFTPKGGKEEPAGIVHKGEYVVPQWVLNTPKGLDYVNLLEAIRTNRSTGYASGGLVGGTSPASAAPTINLETRTDNAALVPLLESIDRKLNGVGLVYLNRQLKDLNANYDRAKADFGLNVK